MKLNDIYTKPLHDLGEKLSPAYAGILSPLYADALLDQYLSPQFTTDSQWYVDQCEHNEFTGRILQRCFDLIGFNPATTDPLTILDIGSGAGNSIFPLLDLMPTQHIIASDLSPQMLAALRNKLLERNTAERCQLLQLNAEEIDFLPESLDMVVGFAVLHHLMAPQNAIASAAKALKPGGIAIFSEPFENGNYLLSMAYRMILSDARAADLPSGIKHLLQARIDFHAARIGVDKTDARFATFDDKWLFMRQTLQQVAHNNGLRTCHIMPLAQTDNPLERKTNVLLHHNKHDVAAVPEWAWNIIHQFENSMSPYLRYEMPVEAAIVMQKQS